MAPIRKTRQLPVPIEATGIERTGAWRVSVENELRQSLDGRVRALHPALVLGIIYAESRGNPNAESPEGSSYGLMQINAGVHWRGKPVQDLFNPNTNIRTGVEILSDAIQARGGDLQAAVSTYNGGHGKRYPAGTQFCLMWKAGAPTTNRNIERDCQVVYVTGANEFGNQPYVDTVFAAAQRFGFVSGAVPAPRPTPSPTPTPTGGTSQAGMVGGIAVAGAAIWLLLKYLFGGK